jgi:multiple sugar transport system substrate-binding protein
MRRQERVMQLRRRDFLSLTGAVGVLTALSGCGSTLPEPDVGRAGFGEQATGTVTVWCRSATQAGVQVAVDRFHKSQDRLRVDLTPVIDGQYVTKLATAIRGGEVPDLVDIDDINSMLFIYRDAFTDLTPLIEALPFRDAISPGHLRLATRKGRIYGVPYLADNSVLFYNRDLFDRAGLDPAQTVTSFDGMLHAAREIRALGRDVYGLSIAGNSPGILGFVVQPHVWATGTDQIRGSIGSQRGHVEGNEPLRRTLAFYRTLWMEHLLPPGNFADSGATWGADFQAGKVGMLPANYAAAVLSADKAARARTGVHLLCGPDGGSAFFDGGDNMCIPRGARNASGAWEFARFAIGLRQQYQLPMGGYSPIRSDIVSRRFRGDYPLDVAALEHINRGYAPVTLAYNLLYNQADSPWIAMFRKAVFAGDLDGALSQGQQAYDRILTQSQL